MIRFRLLLGAISWFLTGVVAIITAIPGLLLGLIGLFCQRIRFSNWLVLRVVGYPLALVNLVVCSFWIGTAWLDRLFSGQRMIFGATDPHKIDRWRPKIIIAMHPAVHELKPYAWWCWWYCGLMVYLPVGRTKTFLEWGLRGIGAPVIDRDKPAAAVREIEASTRRFPGLPISLHIYPCGSRGTNSGQLESAVSWARKKAYEALANAIAGVGLSPRLKGVRAALIADPDAQVIFVTCATSNGARRFKDLWRENTKSEITVYGRPVDRPANNNPETIQLWLNELYTEGANSICERRGGRRVELDPALLED